MVRLGSWQLWNLRLQHLLLQQMQLLLLLLQQRLLRQLLWCRLLWCRLQWCRLRCRHLLRRKRLLLPAESVHIMHGRVDLLLLHERPSSLIVLLCSK